jgi:hypothetical protein
MTNETNITNPAESTNQPATPVQDNAAAYIKALEELRANTVDKKEYERINAENQQLIDALMNGEKMTPNTPSPTVDVKQLRKDLFGGETELSNLEYISKSLELREALMKKGERDPFLPVGDKTTLTADMIDDANQVAALFEHCVQFAQGDSGLFDAELARHTSAAPVPVGGRRR